MQQFLYAFEFKVQELVVAFRCVSFALMVIGLIVHLSRQHYHMAAVVRPLGRALTITAMIASMGWWFPLVENTLLATADFFDEQYSTNPTRAADAIRESATPNPESSGFSWRKVHESIYNGLTTAFCWVFILIASSISGPMFAMQYILKWVLYLLTPFALACFMIPTLQGIAVRFFQQLLAILAWPIGFAITNFVSITIFQEFSNTVAPATTGEVAVAAPFVWAFAAILSCITLLVGTVFTPVICQKLFASGHAFDGSAGSPVSIARMALGFHNQLGAAAARSAAAQSASKTPTQPPSAKPQTPGL